MPPRPDAAAATRAAPALPGGEAFRLRASNYNILTLRLLTPDLASALPALAEQFRRAPGFLRFAPLVVGLEELGAGEAVDFAALVHGLQELEIVPVGVSGGSQEQRAAAAAASSGRRCGMNPAARSAAVGCQ
jgi:septum site-determining protein MinC